MRVRFKYSALILLTIVLGLAARKYNHFFPDFINLGLGDAMWAVMIFWIVRFFSPSVNRKSSFLITILICFAVEFSQLYQANWINEIRNTTPGKLILGRGFLWSDLVAYTIGGITAAIIDFGIMGKQKR